MGNGYITTKVLREILAALDDALKPEDLDGMIAEIDTDGSGTVDFEVIKLACLIGIKDFQFTQCRNMGKFLFEWREKTIQ
ncbi:hypothetical protein J6590_103703 [Homalodisca vitripennis]|nr:hypothetical protein J6590_103703 [Homalodisca vitripennis]